MRKYASSRSSPKLVKRTLVASFMRCNGLARALCTQHLPFMHDASAMAMQADAKNEWRLRLPSSHTWWTIISYVSPDLPWRCHPSACRWYEQGRPALKGLPQGPPSSRSPKRSPSSAQMSRINATAPSEHDR